MIVPMKKVFLLVQDKDSRQAVEGIRSLGFVHVEHLKEPKSRDTENLSEDEALVNHAIGIIESVAPKERLHLSKPLPSGWKIIARHVSDLYKRMEQLREYSLTIAGKIDEWQDWGDFDPQEIIKLREKGVYVYLAQLRPEQIKALPQQAVVKQVFRQGVVANCMVISRERLELPFKDLELPKLSLSAMQTRLYEDTRTMNDLKQEIVRQRVYIEGLRKAALEIAGETEFAKALAGMQSEENLTYIKGYIPVDSIVALKSAAKEHSWAILLQDPGEDDQVPVLLRNPRWASLIQPVLKLLEIIPGYREIDISPVFLLFLGLFFGMIIGDAGYGAVYFLLTMFFQHKLSARVKDKKVFFLFYFFSSCAIMWGLFTGSIFGQAWLVNSGFKPLIPSLNDAKTLEAFCFFLGASHLTLAHLWQGLRKAPSLQALTDAGWICILWAAFFLAKTLILDDPFPLAGKWLIISGVGLVLIFTSPQKNVFKMIGAGLGTLALSLVNNFTDVVSYVRLFAVGLAGLAIADTVNILTSESGSNPLLKIAILTIGHTINIILGPMSVMVHGIRLNVLEFSGHANLSWSGIEYKPLKS